MGPLKSEAPLKPIIIEKIELVTQARRRAAPGASRESAPSMPVDGTAPPPPAAEVAPRHR